MIKINRSRAVDRLHKNFTGPDLIDKLMLLAQARLDGDKIAFKGPISDWAKTKPVLKEEAHGKCCYCEADTATVAHGDVEHFRPKSRYWWLALCIDNYTYSCQICNQSYKGDEFPITGAKLLEPALPKKVPISAAARAKLAAKICPDPATVKDAELRTVWFKEDVVEHGQPACSPTRSTTATADGVRHSQDGIAGRLRCSGRVLDSAGSRHPLRRICWRVTSRQQRRTRRGAATSPTSPLMRAGCT